MFENIPAGTPVGIYDGPDDEIVVDNLTINSCIYQIYDLGGLGGEIDISKGSTYIILKVLGNSMDLAGIDDGDYVLLEPTDIAHHKDIVAALILGYDHHATLKRFIRRGDTIILQPESTNSKYKECRFTRRDTKVQIYGVAKALLKPK